MKKLFGISFILSLLLVSSGCLVTGVAVNRAERQAVAGGWIPVRQGAQTVWLHPDDAEKQARGIEPHFGEWRYVDRHELARTTTPVAYSAAVAADTTWITSLVLIGGRYASDTLNRDRSSSNNQESGRDSIMIKESPGARVESGSRPLFGE